MDGQQPESQQPEPTWQFKPGETISPRQASPAQPAPAKTEQPTAARPVQNETVDKAPRQVDQEARLRSAPNPPAPRAVSQPTAVPRAPQGEFVAWSASEYITHEKTTGWHVLIVAAAIIVAAASWLITKDIVTALVIVVAGVALSLYGARKPSELQYQLDSSGLSIDQKHYLYADFRAFSVVQEGPFVSVQLIPSRRFSPIVSLYFDPEDEDKILNILGTYLPHQERGTDMVEALMRRIRF